MNTDILIIGAGVVGCALARKLSQYQGKIAVLERAEDAGKEKPPFRGALQKHGKSQRF